MNDDSVSQIAADAIDLYREYIDKHGYDEDRAKAAAILEVCEGAAVDVDAERAEMAADVTVFSDGKPYPKAEAKRMLRAWGRFPKAEGQD